MSYNTAEISTQDGRPVALYALRWGKTWWRYTSADRDIPRSEQIDGVLTNVVYKARAVSDSGMVQGASAQNDFTIDCPDDLPIVDLFRGTPPNETIWLTTRRLHYGESDAPIYWIGTVANVKRKEPGAAQIIGRPLSASFKRTGLRLCWTKECPHFLYDGDCKVSMADYKVDATITALTATEFTVNAIGDHPDQYFRGGIVTWTANGDGTIERRMIESQVGNVFTVFGLTDRMVAGGAIKLYPGCDRTPTTCEATFNNTPNYGGFDFMPGKTPFGTQVF